MKKHLILIAAISLSTVTFAQHTQTESKTEITDGKPMLDGKAFAVTLTENSSGTVGTPGSMNSDRAMENTDMTKRDMGDQPNKTGTMTSDLKDGRRMLI